MNKFIRLIILTLIYGMIVFVNDKMTWQNCFFFICVLSRIKFSFFLTEKNIYTFLRIQRISTKNILSSLHTNSI